MLVGWQSCTIFNTWHLNLRRTVNCILSSSSLTQNPAKGRRKTLHGWEGPLEVQEWKSHHLLPEHSPPCREYQDTFGVPATNCHTQAHFNDSIWARFPASLRILQEYDVNSQRFYYCYHLCANVGVAPFTYKSLERTSTQGSCKYG